MLIALIVLAMLNLLFSVLLFCCGRAIWTRLPEPVSVQNTVGDVALTQQAAEAWIAQQRGLRAKPRALTPEEQAEVAAYRASRSDAAHGLSDIEVLALSHLNPA